MNECSCKSCGCCGAEQKVYQAFAGVDHISAFEVVGVSCVISGGGEDAAEEINALWETFFKEQVESKIESRQDDVIYAVYSDYEGDYTKPYRLTIGYKVPEDAGKELPEEFYRVEVKEEDYALISTGGEQPKALLEAWKTVWQSDLDRCYKTDFEVYGSKFFEEGVHEVLVAVGVNVD